MKGLKVFLFLSFLYAAIFGVVALVYPAAVEDMLGSSAPYVRTLAGIGLGFALALWYAFRDPVKNIAIVRAVIVWFGLEALLLLLASFTGDITWSTTLSGIIIDAILAIGLGIYYPRSKPAPAKPAA